MNHRIVLTIALTCLFAACSSNEALGPKILQAKELPNNEVKVSSLVGDCWEQVCAATVTFGAAVSEASGAASEFRRIEESPSYSGDQGKWFLAVFPNKTESPVLHVLSREEIPLVDAMLLDQQLKAVSYRGRPVTCTSNQKATIQAIALGDGNYVFSLFEPN